MSTPEQSTRRIDARCDEFVETYVALDPLTATFIGAKGYDDQLPDLSPEGFQQRADVTRQALADVQALEPVDERERAAKDAFIERLTVDLDQFAAKNPQSQLNVIASQLHEIRETFDLMDADGEEGWASIDKRLAGVPAALNGYRATLDECARDGYVSAKRQIAAVADQIKAWTGLQGRAGNFFTELAAQHTGGPESLRAEVEANARAASEAYVEFARWLESDLLPRGREHDGVGREQYARDSRYFLGAEVDLDETYAWGWHELARIEGEMANVAAQIVPGGSVDDAVAALDAESARTVHGREAFREWMQTTADEAIAEMAETHFDIPEPVRRIECCLAPTNDGGIYYTGPTEDFTRPGRMWWAVPDGIDDFSTWREVTTVYHEGVPGHHLQVGQTAYRHELLNRWQRLMCWVSGHGEGWALYAERLMDDLGYLSDPGNKLGMLDSQGFRAARVIVDIGMHLGLEIPRDNPFGFHPGERWTPELGLEFMLAHSRDEEARVRFEVQRYLGWPGQAPSYKVGERIWLQARDDVQARQGADFDLKRFHRHALDLGSMGLDPLRATLARLPG